MQAWRKNILEHHLGMALTLLEFILSVIFLLVAYTTGNVYFKGVGVGLVIAWVTTGIAFLIAGQVNKK